MNPAFSKYGVMPIIQHMLQKFLNHSSVVESFSNISFLLRIPATNQVVEYIQSRSIRGLDTPHILFLKAAPYWYIRTQPAFAQNSDYILQDATGVFPTNIKGNCNLQYFGSWQDLMHSYKCGSIRNFFSAEEKNFYNQTFGHQTLVYECILGTLIRAGGRISKASCSQLDARGKKENDIAVPDHRPTRSA